MKIAILTSPNQWFIKYAKKLSIEIGAELFFNHKDIKNFDIVFILAYHFIIPEDFLKINKKNLVVHESNLPKGKGWAPLFWQILEGKNRVIFTLFEASKDVDQGDIYLQKELLLDGSELHDKIREKQAILTSDLCKVYLKNQKDIKPKKQSGDESFYLKRTPKDSELDINKTIAEQFNLLRIVNNEEFPAFFYKNGKKYILKIEKAKDE